MGKRSTARRLAMQSLYLVELNKTEAGDALESVADEEDFIEETKAYAISLINGTLEHKKEILDVILKYSKEWTPDRLSIVDKSILMLAVFELLYEKDISKAVVINEAVLLSKKYGGRDSSRFINGILGALADKIKS